MWEDVTIKQLISHNLSQYLIPISATAVTLCSSQGVVCAVSLVSIC